MLSRKPQFRKLFIVEWLAGFREKEISFLALKPLKKIVIFSFGLTLVYTSALQSHTGPVQGQNRVPRWLKQVFPCWEKYTGKTLLSLLGWVCSEPRTSFPFYKFFYTIVSRDRALLRSLVLYKTKGSNHLTIYVCFSRINSTYWINWKV